MPTKKNSKTSAALDKAYEILLPEEPPNPVYSDEIKDFAATFLLGDEYVSKMSEKDRALYRLVRPLPGTTHSESLMLSYINEYFDRQQASVASSGGRVQMNPDFQRGHVWNKDQKVAFIEAILRGTAPMKVIFNSPSYRASRPDGDLPEYDLVCVDGLQRITAVQEFVRGEFRIFDDTMSYEDLEGTSFSFRRTRFKFDLYIYAFNRRKDLLEFYISINSGGTVHTKEELDRVRALIVESEKK